MSNETIAVILSALGLLVTLGGGAAAGLAWVVRRIDALDMKLSTRIDEVQMKLSARIDQVERDVTEVKITVARIDGRSQPPLMLTR
ncbi:hypothetical protein [Leucobacter sp. wl10]|uniref:hypothetical protein n=1 Tax=Leucobacter sp. wl10 TaxID=2304677 RepID=UPI000E5B7D53|nr:hypothetical protein [Leucobacter sp. wl10]RGE18863.1 hypothetical protein D1J51_14210 [Leucobacter sp. wl10]